MVQQFIGQQHIFSHTYLSEVRLWGELETAIAAKHGVAPASKTIITGHSLGGGIGQVVAARAQLEMVAWAAPGVVYSAMRFGVDTNAAKHIIAVNPDGDAVSKVDKHAGVVYQLGCLEPDGSLGSAATCHSM